MRTINISSKSDDWRARKLSNFSSDPFVLDGETFASVEGFIQGTKFPPENPTRQKAFLLTGIEAKRCGLTAERKFVWWKESVIDYGSVEHRRLIERAIRAKFEQNEEAMEALLATNDLVLIHDLGEPEPTNSSLPAKIFCGILTQIRSEVQYYRQKDG